MTGHGDGSHTRILAAWATGQTLVAWLKEPSVVQCTLWHAAYGWFSHTQTHTHKNTHRQPGNVSLTYENVSFVVGWIICSRLLLSLVQQLLFVWIGTLQRNNYMLFQQPHCKLWHKICPTWTLLHDRSTYSHIQMDNVRIVIFHLDIGEKSVGYTPLCSINFQQFSTSFPVHCSPY